MRHNKIAVYFDLSDVSSRKRSYCVYDTLKDFFNEFDIVDAVWAMTRLDRQPVLPIGEPDKAGKLILMHNKYKVAESHII